MLRNCTLFILAMSFSSILSLPCEANPWGEFFLRLGRVDSQGPGSGMAIGGEADLLFALGRKFQTGIEFGLYGGSSPGSVSQGSWQWRFRTPTGVARPYATIGTGVYWQ